MNGCEPTLRSETLQDALHEDDEEVWHLNCGAAMKIITDYCDGVGDGEGDGEQELTAAPTVELTATQPGLGPSPSADVDTAAAVVPVDMQPPPLEPVKVEPAVKQPTPTLSEKESTPVLQVDSSPSPSPTKRSVPLRRPPAAAVVATRLSGKQSPAPRPSEAEKAPAELGPSESEKALAELRSSIAAKSAKKVYEGASTASEGGGVDKSKSSASATKLPHNSRARMSVTCNMPRPTNSPKFGYTTPLPPDPSPNLADLNRYDALKPPPGTRNLKPGMLKQFRSSACPGQSQAPPDERARGGGRGRGGRGGRGAKQPQPRKAKAKAKANSKIQIHEDDDTDEEHDDYATPPRKSKRV